MSLSGGAEVLQEYLVKLGYKVDPAEQKKFVDALGVVGKRVLGVGAAVAGVVAAVEAASAEFAYSMRKVYFDSQLANTSIKNLKSMEYAGKQFGISAEAMGSAMHSMAQALRLNPGLQGVIEGMGVKVTGRDISDVMTDYVRAINKMPEFTAAGFAGMFGIDPDTYHLMREHIDEIVAKQKELKDAYAAVGLDYDKSAEKVKHYADSLDNLKEHFTILKDSILTDTAPAFDKLASSIAKAFDETAKQVNNEGLWKTIQDRMYSMTPFPYYAKGWEWLKGVLGGKSDGTPTTAAQRSTGVLPIPGAPGAAGGAAAGLAGLHRNERNNNPGNIEYGPWAKAHGATGSDGRFAIFPNLMAGYDATEDLLKSYGRQGRNTVSSIMAPWAPSFENNTKAYTDFVAKQLGVGVNDKLDMNDQNTIARLTRYIARFEGMSDRGLAMAPHVTNTFNITGNNAKEIADRVAGAQTRVMADAMRNSQTAVR